MNSFIRIHGLPYLLRTFLRLHVPNDRLETQCSTTTKDTFTRCLGHAMADTLTSGKANAKASPSSDAANASLGNEDNGRRRGFMERQASLWVGRAGGPGGGELYWPYLTRAAEILTNFSKSDSVVKEGVAQEQCLQGNGSDLVMIIVIIIIFFVTYPRGRLIKLALDV